MEPIEHLSGHHFVLTIELQSHAEETRVTWRQAFDSIEQYGRLAEFVAVANEQNLARLSDEVVKGEGTA
jgi:hypothetical protein